jgi:hypothetical protein
MEADRKAPTAAPRRGGAWSSQLRGRHTVSTESIASTQQDTAAASCASCGSPLAEDQRYCLQCGERIAPPSSVLLGGPPSVAVVATAEAPTAQLAPPGYPLPGAGGGFGEHERRGNAVTVIAGVGVLLLAMGVGVLIGRSSAKQPSAPVAPAVISVASASPSATTGAGEATFRGDWPAGTSAYTVELQTLATSATQVSAVEAAKTAASAKGAKSVGALKSDEYSSLPAGDYVVYSGTYKQKAEAQKALADLKSSFPAAKVIDVSAGAGKASGTGSSSTAGASKSGVGASESKPAPPSVVEDLRKTKGKSYEEKSKNLPDVVSTG